MHTKITQGSARSTEPSHVMGSLMRPRDARALLSRPVEALKIHFQRLAMTTSGNSQGSSSRARKKVRK